ncbi:MAG: aldehyde dehydrogenase family protein, partial [Thermoproteota archaeon]|nr:aldehyde dehydrogenase family protein [Thermoproteota archaeon]
MFSNERTLHRFLTEKTEGQFHDRYEKALEQVRSEFGRAYTMVIGGSEVMTSTTVKHTSPIDTRIVLGYMPIGGARHVRKTVAAAKEAFEHWGKVDYRERVHVCRVAANIVAEHKFELAAWVSYENGKNRYEAIADIDEAIDFLRYYSEEMERNNGFEIMMNSALPNERNRSVMKPYGIWGVIAPFNFPAAIFVGMCTGAIITGNTVVAKPSSNTPIIASKFAEIFKQAGLPDGVFNLVIGTGGKIGNELIRNKDVAGIVFT